MKLPIRIRETIGWLDADVHVPSAIRVAGDQPPLTPRDIGVRGSIRIGASAILLTLPADESASTVGILVAIALTLPEGHVMCRRSVGIVVWSVDQR